MEQEKDELSPEPQAVSSQNTQPVLKPQNKTWVFMIICILISAASVGITLAASKYLGNKKVLPTPIPLASPSPTPKTFSKAETETIWDTTTSATKKSGDLSVTTRKSEFGPGYFSIEINIENLSKDYKNVEVGANDFTLLDGTGKSAGQPTNGYVDKYIPLEKTNLYSGDQLVGNVVFTNIPDNLGTQTITLRYLPEIDGAKAIEMTASVPLPVSGKPVIYLYPTQIQKVLVRLMFNGQFIFTYPEYDESIGGWNVTANPDGTIIGADGKTYSYIFWDGVMNFNDFKFDKGFVVPGNETSEFLQKILPEIGLIPREYNEFIVYWTPKLKNNKYNLIYFAGKEYTDNAKLEITPTPDSLLRVYMVYKPLDNLIQVEPQTFPKFERKGFTVVEWGGRELN